MPKPDAPPLTRGVVLRAFGLAVAVALGGFSAWLIVTGTTQKRLEIGVLAGLWAVLLATFAMFGSRRLAHPLADLPQPGAPTGAALELRSRQLELERAEELVARREHEARLEQLLRHEIHVAVSGEIAVLRAEIAQLRSELLEKVGGQLRLERIETTRVIGSDLEALQHEVRQLKTIAQDGADFATVSRPRPGDTGSIRPIVEPARVRPVSREAAEVQAEVQPATEPEPADTTGPIRVDDASRTPRPTPAPSGEVNDELGGLPRITPFTDFELDPIEDEPAYTGRRRRRDADDGEGDGNDLLAKLLARESSRH